jgi:hypothetical protein
VRRASATCALGLALAACGGSTPHSTSAASQTRPQQTVTISAAQADAQGKCVIAEGVSAKPTSARCARILAGQNLPTVIDCGGGVLTNGSCLFAKRVASAYQDASFGAQQNAAVNGDEVDVTVTGNPVVCLLARPGVRRCKSSISQVWVQFTAA